MPKNLMASIETGAFWLAMAALALAFVEGALQLLGQSLTGQTYSAGRLLEFATMLMIFVGVLNLRSMRGALERSANADD